MEMILSRDYRFILGKLSLDINFAEAFFNSTEAVLGNFSLSVLEKEKLTTLSKKRFQSYKDTILRSGDCDSCCNGGEGGGNCSECSSSCCQ